MNTIATIPITEWIISNDTESLITANAIVVINVIKKPTDSITVTVLFRFEEKNRLYHFRCL